MPRRELLPLQWPARGLNETPAHYQPGELSTSDCLNVRPFDSLDRRLRGGQRTGMDKYFATAPSGSEVQSLSSAVEAVALTEDAGFGDKYADMATAPMSTFNSIVEVSWSPAGDRVIVVMRDSGAGSGRVALYEWDDVTGWGARLSIKQSSFTAGLEDGYHAVWSPDGEHYFLIGKDHSSGLGEARVWSVAVDAGGSQTEVSTVVPVAGVYNGDWVGIHPDGDVLFAVVYAPGTLTYTMTAYSVSSGVIGSVIDSTNEDITTSPEGLSISPDGTHVVAVRSFTLKALPFDKVTGFGTTVVSPTYPEILRSVDWHPDGTHVVAGFRSISSNRLGVVPFSSGSGFGSMILGGPAGFGDTEAVAFNPAGTYILASVDVAPYMEAYPWSGVVGTAVPAPSPPPDDNSWLASWNPSGTVVVTGYVSIGSPQYPAAYKFTPEEVNPSARKTRVVAVQGGSVYRSDYPPSTLVLSNAGAGVLRTALPVSATPAYQKVFFVDGVYGNYSYLDLADNTVYDWAGALTDGSLPRGTDDNTLGARFGVLYRGRLVLAGLQEDPQNWFMSKSGDPFDFQYSPTTTSQLQAVAGNNSNAGLLEDTISALMPYQDDVMLMGGSHSLWIMRGDPAAGGAIDNISRQIGVTGDQAWTWDATGNLYFFGANGLYRMAPSGGVPELISRNRLDKRFSEINTSVNTVRLAYDREWQGVHIFVVPTTVPSVSGDHYFWDERTDSFWRDQYPVTTGPTAVHRFEGDSPERRSVLLGGFDGNIRRFTDTATDDDGVAITSKILFPPVIPAASFASVRVDDILVTLDSDSGDVDLSVYTGDTPEVMLANAVAGSNPAIAKTLVGGRNNPIRQRISQNALGVVLGQSSLGPSWAFESGGMTTAVLSRMRNRGV